MNKRITKIITGFFFCVAAFASCIKNNMPFCRIQYVTGAGEEIRATISEKNIFRGPFISGPGFNCGTSLEDGTYYCFFSFGAFQSPLPAVEFALFCDTPLFYEGVRYHFCCYPYYSHFRIDQQGEKTGDKFEAAWIEPHYGTGSIAFYILFEVQYSEDFIVSGRVDIYNRLVRSDNIKYKEWLKPASENPGDTEVWYDSYAN